MSSLADLLTDVALVGDFGAETVRRGREYAAVGAVRDVRVVEERRDTLRAVSTVTGSGRSSYHVLLTVSAYHDGYVDVWSRCSCPVAEQCKHGVATAVALRGRDDEAPTRWEHDLETLLRDLSPADETASKALAILVHYRPADRRRWGDVDAAVHLRLVRQGARGNWVKSGISWSTAAHAASRREFRTEELDALTGLCAGLKGDAYYHSSVEEPRLHEFGPLVWSSLRRVMEAGVHIEYGDNVAGLDLRDEPLDVAADVVSGQGGARLLLGVEHDGELWSGERLLPVGAPAHGVVLLTGEPPEVNLLLAPLRRPVASSTVRLLVAKHPIRLPDQDRDRWSGTVLPRLGRHVHVRSSDGSVEVPDLPAPVLELEVEWRSAADAALAWRWSYGDGPTRRSCSLSDDDELDGIRDRAAERELLARVPWPHRPDDEVVTGPVALDLATRLLPALDGIDGLRLVERNRPDFRASTGEVEIAFDTEEPSEPTESGRPVDWLDLLVTVRVDGERVPLPSVIEALTLGHDQLVLPSGLYVPTDRPELARLLDLVHAAGELRERDGESV